jgi:hypothetical protein
MSIRVESILITKQETIVLPRIEPIMTQGVPMDVKVRYNELRLNQ